MVNPENAHNNAPEAMNPHIKYRQLRAFSLVARARSFKAAADAMAITQSSLSALIKELENDLGQELLIRTTRVCKLTEAGAAFLEDISGPLNSLEEAYVHAKKLGAGNRGKLDLAALSSLCSGVLVRELAQYQKLYPGVRIRLTEGSHVGVVEAVRSGSAELGIGSKPKSADNLVFKALFADHLMLISPEGHASAEHPAHWQTLAQFPLILMAPGFVERALAAVGVTAHPAFEVQQSSTALAMVRHGMGVTVLPSSILANFVTEGLTCRPIESELAIRQLGTIRRADVKPSEPSRQFSEMLESACEEPHMQSLVEKLASQSENPEA